MSPILGIIASAQQGAAVGDYESIATVTVGGGGSSSISFTSIPSTYQHLQIRCFGVMSDNDAFGGLRFNSDTGNNYAIHQFFGDGSTVGATGNANFNLIRTIVSAASGANPTTGAIIDILDYKDTNKYKTVRTLTGSDTNGAGYMVMRSGVWMNTNAVSSLTIDPNAGTFNQYSSFALYGIK